MFIFYFFKDPIDYKILDSDILEMFPLFFFDVSVGSALSVLILPLVMNQQDKYFFTTNLFIKL